MALTKISFLVLFFISGFKAIALVNPTDLTYSITHSDGLERNYHSARKSAGLLGRGWCTPLETRLNKKPEQIEFNFCGGGKVVRFIKRGSDWMAEDPSYKLSQNAQGMTVTVGLKQVFEFDKTGALKNPRPSDTPFKVAGGRIREVSKEGKTWVYIYTDDLLTSVRVDGKPVYQYQYDKIGRLLSVTAGGLETRVEYGPLGVEKVSAGPCVQTIKAKRADKGLNVESEMACGRTSKVTKTFEVLGASRASELTVRESVNKKLQRERTWRNSRLVKNTALGRTVEYSYDANGLLAMVRSPGETFKVASRQGGLPLKVMKIDKKGREQHFNLTWSGGRLKEVAMGSVRIQVQHTGAKKIYRSNDFALTGRAQAGEWLLGGRLNGAQVKEFSTRSPASALSLSQADLLSLWTSLDAMSAQLEAL